MESVKCIMNKGKWGQWLNQPGGIKLGEKVLDDTWDSASWGRWPQKLPTVVTFLQRPAQKSLPAGEGGGGGLCDHMLENLRYLWELGTVAQNPWNSHQTNRSTPAQPARNCWAFMYNHQPAALVSGTAA